MKTFFVINSLLVISLFVFINISLGQTSKNSHGPRYNPIYQFSYQHGNLPRDSVVLKYIGNEKTDFYNSIKIYRGKKLIFNQLDTNWELIAYPEKIFTEQWNRNDDSYFYILELFNAPEPSQFLIIKTNSNKTILFGTTPASTAEIFGDIDFDGIFEIGGFYDYCQEDEHSKCPDSNFYQIIS